MLKKFIGHFDMYSSLATLRIDNQSQLRSFCGGIISIFIMGILTFLFMSSFIQIVQLEQITSLEINQMTRSQTSFIENQTFAIGLFGASIVSLQNYLNVSVYIISGISAEPEIQLHPCTREDWHMINDEIFNLSKLEECFCPVKKSDLEVVGFITSSTFQTVSVHILTCNNLTYSGQCATPQEINSLFDTQFRYLIGRILFLSTSFNPTQQDPIVNTISQEFNWLPLQQNLSLQAVITLGTFQIQTDISFWPFEDIVKQNGYFIDSYMTNVMEGHDHLSVLDLYIFNSRRNKKLIRKYGKFDELLGYIGGLFGIFISFFGFFMVSYNQYRYQIKVAQGAFNYGDDGSKIKANQFTIFKYIKYSIFDWINLLCCCQPNWLQCKQIEETRDQINKQLDVGYLLKRIQYLQRAFQYLIPGAQLDSLFLIQPPTHEQVRKKRMKTQYYDNIIRGKEAVTIQDVVVKNNVQNIIKYGKYLSQQSQAPLVQIGDMNSKRSLNDQVDKSRNNILELAIQNLKEKIQIDHQIELNQEEAEIQDQIALSFFNMSEKARKKIQEKVPLKIIYRLKNRLDDWNKKTGFSIQI